MSLFHVQGSLLMCSWLIRIQMNIKASLSYLQFSVQLSLLQFSVLQTLNWLCLFRFSILSVQESAWFYMVFPHGSAVKESVCNVGDLGSIPGLEGSPGEGNSYSLKYSGLENSMDCIVHEVKKSWTRLSDFHTFTVALHDFPLTNP